MGMDRIRVSHLQFEDDTIFFSKAFMEDLQDLKLVLLVFGNLSRLKINLDKSTLFGINTHQDLVSMLKLMLECKVWSWL